LNSADGHKRTISKLDPTKSKPGAPKSKSGAAESKPNATKSKLAIAWRHAIKRKFFKWL
jgi:hypothetical protein